MGQFREIGQCSSATPHRTSGKVPLWENLKIISELSLSISRQIEHSCIGVCVFVFVGFARVVVGVYVCCAVCTLLRVQLSVLGGEFTQRDQAGHVIVT